MNSTPTRVPQGKRLLLDAASRLLASQTSAQSVSLRELAREAGLNHNTFYRHFESIEQLLQSVLADYAQELRSGLSTARQRARASGPGPVSGVVIGWVLDFALAHRDVFVVSIREYYGPPGPLRDGLRTMVTQIEEDMLADLRTHQYLPDLPDETLRPLLRVINDHAFKLCMAHLEDPSQRADKLRAAEVLFETLMLGAVARHQACCNAS